MDQQQAINKISKDNGLNVDEMKKIFMSAFEKSVIEVQTVTQDTTETKKIIREVLGEFSAEQKEVLTAGEAAQLLKLSETAIMNAYRDGEIPGFKIRGRVRFFKSKILEAMNKPVKQKKPERNPAMTKLDMYKTNKNK
jgi:excisionase family DNA binding protein